MEPEALCISCGMCCDGTLFELVSVTDREAAALETRGVRVGRRASGRVLELPCGALTPGGCAVWAERPASCARFVCTLRHGLEAGRLGFAEARAVVDEARQRLAARGDAARRDAQAFLHEHFED